jgi:two-component system, OmpR family, sensor histidine kinase MprB
MSSNAMSTNNSGVEIETSTGAGRKTRAEQLRARYSPRRLLVLKRLFSWHTFRSRITMLVVLAVGLSVAIGALISYVSIGRAINNNVDNDLRNRAQLLSHTPLADPDNILATVSLTTAQNNAVALSMAGLQETILNADGSAVKPVSIRVGSTVYNNQAPYGQTELEVAQGTLDYSMRTIESGGQAYRVYAIPDHYGGELGLAAPNSALVVSESLASTQNTLSTLATVSIIVGLLGIALAGAACFAIGRAALRPVEELSKATEYIARTGDLRSLPVIGDDELAQLTRNFNTMLEALARSQEHQKRLVADAGHELRTPLTSMRTNLDLLAQVMATPNDDRMPFEERVALMNDVRAQMGELSVLISDLVELSRDEHPSHAIEHLDMRDVVNRAAERVQRRAPTLTYDVQLSSWYLDGDAGALERLVTNLMDNAAKWSPEGGTVTVTLAEGSLQVADQGPGIAE